MSIHAVYLSHLPRGISASELKLQFLKIVSTACHDSNIDEERIQIDVYESSRGTTATASGFCLDWNATKSAFREHEIKWGSKQIKLNIKPDFGAPRNQAGDIIVKHGVISKRMLDMLVGETHRRILDFLPDSMLRLLNPGIFTGHTDSTYSGTGCLNKEVILAVGGIDHITNSGDLNIIKFHTIMEQLQGIAVLNKSPEAYLDRSKSGQRLMQFSDRYGNLKCALEIQCGLGRKGQILPLYDISQRHGYIPFDELHDRFVDREYIAKLTGRCCRCNLKYRIKGIQIDLQSYAGTCSCLYPDQSDLDSTEVERVAIRWNNERFTRLIPGEMTSKLAQIVPVIIQHHPIKTEYQDPVDYERIMLPLLEDEMTFRKQQYETDFKCHGSVWQSKLMNDTGTSKAVQVMVVEVVRYSKAWQPGNPKSINKLKLLWNNGLERTCDLFKITVSPVDTTNVRLYVQLSSKRLEFKAPIQNDIVTVIPLPNNSDHGTLAKSINKWVKHFQNGQTQKHKEILLRPFDGGEPGGWKLSPADIILTKSEKIKSPNFIIQMRRMKHCLNSEQLQAYNNAIRNSLSLISGPPGTGKSRTLVTILCRFAMQEQGRILVCAPSNFAADNIANDIALFSRQYKLNRCIRLLRMYSKSKELEMNAKVSQSQVSDPHTFSFDVLHLKVKEQLLMSTDSRVTGTANLFYRDRSYNISPLDISHLENEIAILEKTQISKYNILVCTLGTVYDKSRIGKDLNIKTIIVDEAGQVTQPGLIPLMDLNPMRMILAGDQHQLRATVSSYAAEVAGLDKSLIEMCSWNYKSHSDKNLPPFTSLKTQHRMHSEIRHIVSQLTYDGTLVDSCTREYMSLPNSIKCVMDWTCNKRVMVMNHNCIEQRSGHSFVNRKEAAIIASMVDDFQTKGVPASDILILSFYDAQRELIRSLIPHENVSVENVDSVQGGEANIVIISFVRCSTKGSIGFLKSPNRLNVAMSRAREYLILAMSLNQFDRKGTPQHLKKLVYLLQEHAEIKHVV